MSNNQQPFIRADYQGGSIANIPATVAAITGAPFTGLPPLHAPLWQSLAAGAQRVVLLLVDAMGWNLFQGMRAQLAPMLEGVALEEKITSIFPSTTVAALSSLWTGVAPSQHGFVGFRLFLPEAAVLGQMLQFTPQFASMPDALLQAGVQPETFLQAPGFAETLAQGGVPTYLFKSYNLLGTVLSRMHDRGTKKRYPIVTAADMFRQMRQLLEDTAGERLYLSAYWPAIDTLSHMHGWNHPAVAAELRSLFQLLQEELLRPLSAAARAGTVLFVTADHGQILTPPSQEIHLDDHPRLKEMLLMRPAGEPRTVYLYARQGQAKAVLHYLQDELADALYALPAEQALDEGLLGPAPFAAQTPVRVGDVIATMRDGYILLSADEVQNAYKMKARHGGLTAAEMEVPWLAFRIDG